MIVEEIFAKFGQLSNEKMIAQHAKNGVLDNLFGVKMGDIRSIANKIKTDHDLALQLWQTGNLDARLLACLIFNPKALSIDEMDDLVKSINLPWLADWFNSYVLKEYPDKEILREKWLDSANKWAARSAWSLTAGRVSRNSEGLNLAEILSKIEVEMPAAAPEKQWTMNTALAQIGINFPEHRKRALEIGERLGIYRDFPVSKGCTSPFAPVWINEMVSRQK